MKRIREILLSEYIGAITIGFLLAQAVGGIIGTILNPIVFYIENRKRPQSIFGPQQSYFNWSELIVSLVQILLYLLAAWLLLYWLYLRKRPESVAVPEAPADRDVSETPP